MQHVRTLLTIDNKQVLIIIKKKKWHVILREVLDLENIYILAVFGFSHLRPYIGTILCLGEP